MFSDMKHIFAGTKQIVITITALTALCLSTSLAYSTEEDEIAELRQMVMILKGEVDALKQALADKEANRNVPSPIKSEQDSIIRKPIDVPSVASVSSKYGLSFYGYFKLDALYDTGLPSHQEIPFWVRPETPTNQGKFDMTAKETRLGMNFSGPTVSGGKLGGKIEFDFFGKINTPGDVAGNHAFQPRSRHAYLNWDFGDWSLLAGQTWEPYLLIFPQSVNFGYNNFMGQLGLRKSQLRLTRKVGNWEIAGAIIEPVGGVHGGDLDGDGQDDAADAAFPTMSGKMVYKAPLFNDIPATVGMSFVYGRENIDLHPVGDSKEYDAWAVVGAFTLPISDSITWSTSVFKGANMDSYWGGIGQGINLSARKEVSGYGGWTELKFKSSEKWTFNLGYSIDNPDDDSLWSGARSNNETYRFNTFYSFSPSLIWAFEYLKMETTYKDDDCYNNDHLHSSIIFKF